MYEVLAVLAVFTVVYGAVAGRLERTWISGPIVFSAFGVCLGPAGIGLISQERDPELLKSMAEVTLALVLFADASGANLGVLRRASKLPVRLLAIGLPLTILLGFVAGKLLFGEMGVFEIALLAIMLAPTDAALGKAVVSNKSVPDDISQGLNVESGLNDGICVPILFLFLALITGEGSGGSVWQMGLHLFAEEVGIGLAVGCGLTAIAVVGIRLCLRREWVADSWRQAIVVALAFACFGTAQSLGGSGFIASFAGGLLFGALLGQRREDLVEQAESIGDVLALLTWVLFGAAIMGLAIGHISWPALLYAVLSLTVIRMLPVFLSLGGLGISTEGKLFLGWFGPRGLASIVFVVIVGSSGGVENASTMSLVVAYTVTLSIILHGVTANPWANGFGARTSREASKAS